MSEELTGALYFSREHPHIVGHVTIDGIEYEIVGVRRSEIRSEIAARARGPVQGDIFEQDQAKAEAALDRNKWRALGPARQAGIRCKDAVFWAYLREELLFPVNNEEQASQVVRDICCVESRSDLGKPGKGEERERWNKLDDEFLGWRAKENA